MAPVRSSDAIVDRVPDVARRRLRNQHLAAPTLTNPADLVRDLVAVQAQDFAGAKWALGQRLLDATDAAIERAFDEGRILRTHVLRPTWHFVAPEDIRWMLRLTGPRISGAMSSYGRKLSLNEAEYTRSNRTLTAALSNGPLTRGELRDALRRARINVDGLRFSFILLRAEVDGLVCSGPRKGRELTWARLDDRAPRARMLGRSDALAELTRRYFTTRGPATLHDFAWWSGLTVADARAGVEMSGSKVASETIDRTTYWCASPSRAVKRTGRTSFLLPMYDEYLIAYRDRSAVVDQRVMDAAKESTVLTGAPVVIDGRVAGWWKATVAKGVMTLTIRPSRPLERADRDALAPAAARYGSFLGMKVQLT